MFQILEKCSHWGAIKDWRPLLGLSHRILERTMHYEELQRFIRARDSSFGYFSGRRRRACLRRFRRRTPARFSGVGRGIRRHAQRRVGTSLSSDRTLSEEIWGAHTADPTPGRERVRTAHAGMVNTSARAR